MSRFRRLVEGGSIDRSIAHKVKYNGFALQGFEGDTLASAMLAANKIIIGRSFKYHRPRGVMSAGVEESNALFTIGKGGNQQPNINAAMLKLTGDLRVKSQNAWPSPRFDAMAVNQLFSPFFGAGFYYKTFMGLTKKSWMFFEPSIRRAAGLGKTGSHPTSQRHDNAFSFCDVLIVGSGPAGLALAQTLAGTSLRVTVVEQDFELCGSILASTSTHLRNWRNVALEKITSAQNIRVLSNATVQGIYDDNQAVISIGASQLEMLRASKIVFACGSHERPMLFEGNDRPGVMLASALQTYANRFAVVPDKKAVITTNNDTAYQVAFDLIKHDVTCTIIDERLNIDSDLLAQAAQAQILVFSGSRIVRVNGRGQVSSVKIEGSHDLTLECDAVGMSGGWSPAVHLTSHGGVKPVYNETISAFVPGTLPDNQFAIGACKGSLGILASINEAQALAKILAGKIKLNQLSLPEIAADRPYVIKQSVKLHKSNKIFADFQNDVTTKDIFQAKDEGYSHIEHMKRYTTLGMGTDQGKTSNVQALSMMAALQGASVAATGTTTFRPPYTPLTIGAIAGRSVGAHFRPTRRSPLHEWNEKNGATFIEAGLWKRAWYYAWAGTSPETAYVKEMELVRRGVGLADVSTLGKIDVQGKDAAEFLNRVYVNGFAKLPIGKARYGVMLNDDGLVLDDGTTSRISETQFYLTTTTAQAGEVMSWLEFLLQCHWTDLEVHVTSLTDEWGGMALSGPKSRDVLQAAFPEVDVSNEALPYMAVMDIVFEDVPVRILRLSFSGELAYEIHCPANFTQSLWVHMMQVGAPQGIKPYGLEALASLRIEKGHVAGMELDHRNSLDDLGLGKMASKKKSYVGEVLRERVDLLSPTRWSLVGLELLDPDKKLRGGAILFAKDDEIKGHGRGYVTSVTWSTELKCFIALGLFEGGLEHENAEIIAAFPVKNEQARLRIVSPHFIDRAGHRLNA